MSPTSYQAAPPRINAADDNDPLERRQAGCAAPERWLFCRALDRAVPSQDPSTRPRRSALNPNRFRGGAALVAVAVSLCLAGRAHGAAEVRRLSLTISGNPTSI